MRIRTGLAALGAATALSLSLVGFASAAVTPAQTGPDSKACVDARKNVVDVKAALDLAVKTETDAETALLKQAKDALAAALPGLREFNPNVYPGNVVPALGSITPALLNQVLADPELGGGARDAVNRALTLFANVATAEKALTTDNEATAGVRARLQIAVFQERRSCAPVVTTTPPVPTTTTVPPTTSGTPAPTTTHTSSPSTSDNDDSNSNSGGSSFDNDDDSSLPLAPAETGGYDSE